MPEGNIALWGWHVATSNWVKLAVTGAGALAIDMAGISLDDIGNVNAPAPADGDALVYDDATGLWVPAAPTVAVHGADKHTDITREVFLSAGEAFAEAGALKALSYYAVIEGLANGDQPKAEFTMKVPDDFVSFTKVEAVWTGPAAAGNMHWYMRAKYGASTEAFTTHADEPAMGVTATGGANIINVQEPANPLTLANLAAGDYLGIQFYRNGAHADDTLDNVVRLLGLLFTYTANQ